MDAVTRQAITALDRLIATLRLLATGRCYDLRFTTGIAAKTLRYIIPETCRVMYEALKDKHTKANFKEFYLYPI
jgi:hypothetical protein